MHTDKQTDRHTKEQTDRQTDRQTDYAPALSACTCLVLHAEVLTCLTPTGNVFFPAGVWSTVWKHLVYWRWLQTSWELWHGLVCAQSQRSGMFLWYWLNVSDKELHNSYSGNSVLVTELVGSMLWGAAKLRQFSQIWIANITIIIWAGLFKAWLR